MTNLLSGDGLTPKPNVVLCIVETKVQCTPQYHALVNTLHKSMVTRELEHGACNLIDDAYR